MNISYVIQIELINNDVLTKQFEYDIDKTGTALYNNNHVIVDQQFILHYLKEEFRLWMEAHHEYHYEQPADALKSYEVTSLTGGVDIFFINPNDATGSTFTLYPQLLAFVKPVEIKIPKPVLKGACTGNTSITWFWEENSYSHYVADADGNILASVPIGISSWNETGLNVNMHYTRQLVSFDTTGSSEPSERVTVQTVYERLESDLKNYSESRLENFDTSLIAFPKERLPAFHSGIGDRFDCKVYKRMDENFQEKFDLINEIYGVHINRVKEFDKVTAGWRGVCQATQSYINRDGGIKLKLFAYPSDHIIYRLYRYVSVPVKVRWRIRFMIMYNTVEGLILTGHPTGKTREMTTEVRMISVECPLNEYHNGMPITVSPFGKTKLEVLDSHVTGKTVEELCRECIPEYIQILKNDYPVDADNFQEEENNFDLWGYVIEDDYIFDNAFPSSHYSTTKPREFMPSGNGTFNVFADDVTPGVVDANSELYFAGYCEEQIFSHESYIVREYEYRFFNGIDKVIIRTPELTNKPLQHPKNIATYPNDPYYYTGPDEEIYTWLELVYKDPHLIEVENKMQSPPRLFHDLMETELPPITYDGRGLATQDLDIVTCRMDWYGESEIFEYHFSDSDPDVYFQYHHLIEGLIHDKQKKYFFVIKVLDKTDNEIRLILYHKKIINKYNLLGSVYYPDIQTVEDPYILAHVGQTIETPGENPFSGMKIECLPSQKTKPVTYFLPERDRDPYFITLNGDFENSEDGKHDVIATLPIFEQLDNTHSNIIYSVAIEYINPDYAFVSANFADEFAFGKTVIPGDTIKFKCDTGVIREEEIKNLLGRVDIEDLMIYSLEKRDFNYTLEKPIIHLTNLDYPRYELAVKSTNDDVVIINYPTEIFKEETIFLCDIINAVFLKQVSQMQIVTIINDWTFSYNRKMLRYNYKKPLGEDAQNTPDPQYSVILSPGKYDNYVHEVVLKNTESTNGIQGLVIAAFKNAVGRYSFLSIIRHSADSDLPFITDNCNNNVGFALVFSDGSPFNTVIEDFSNIAGITRDFDWKDYSFRIRVERYKDTLDIFYAENNDELDDSRLIKLNLNDSPMLSLFKDKTQYGYIAGCQLTGMFDNIKFRDMSVPNTEAITVTVKGKQNVVSRWSPRIHNGYYYLNQDEYFIYCETEVPAEKRALRKYKKKDGTVRFFLDLEHRGPENLPITITKNSEPDLYGNNRYFTWDYAHNGITLLPVINGEYYQEFEERTYISPVLAFPYSVQEWREAIFKFTAQNASASEATDIIADNIDIFVQSYDNFIDQWCEWIEITNGDIPAVPQSTAIRFKIIFRPQVKDTGEQVITRTQCCQLDYDNLIDKEFSYNVHSTMDKIQLDNPNFGGRFVSKIIDFGCMVHYRLEASDEAETTNEHPWNQAIVRLAASNHEEHLVRDKLWDQTWFDDIFDIYTDNQTNTRFRFVRFCIDIPVNGQINYLVEEIRTQTNIPMNPVLQSITVNALHDPEYRTKSIQVDVPFEIDSDNEPHEIISSCSDILSPYVEAAGYIWSEVINMYIQWDNNTFDIEFTNELIKRERTDSLGNVSSIEPVLLYHTIWARTRDIRLEKVFDRYVLFKDGRAIINDIPQQYAPVIVEYNKLPINIKPTDHDLDSDRYLVPMREVYFDEDGKYSLTNTETIIANDQRNILLTYPIEEIDINTVSVSINGTIINPSEYSLTGYQIVFDYEISKDSIVIVKYILRNSFLCLSDIESMTTMIITHTDIEIDEALVRFEISRDDNKLTQNHLSFNPVYRTDYRGFVYIDYNDMTPYKINIYANPHHVFADGKDGLDVQVLVLDENFNPVLGEILEISARYGRIRCTSYITDPNGVVKFRYTSYTNPCTDIITVKCKSNKFTQTCEILNRKAT